MNGENSQGTRIPSSLLVQILLGPTDYGLPMG